MLVHKLSAEDAIGLGTQTNQIHCNRYIKSEGSRKTKRRTYQKRYCPVTGCSKLVASLENHLRQTRKVKDNKVYKKLLKNAIVHEELKTESDCTTTESESDDYQEFKRMMKTGGKPVFKTN